MADYPIDYHEGVCESIYSDSATVLIWTGVHRQGAKSNGKDKDWGQRQDSGPTLENNVHQETGGVPVVVCPAASLLLFLLRLSLSYHFPQARAFLRNFPDLPPGHLLRLSIWCFQITLRILTFPKPPPSADTSACHYLISLSMYITSSSALLFLVCLTSATCVLIHYLFMTCLPCRSLSFQVASFSVHFHLDLDFTQKL